MFQRIQYSASAGQTQFTIPFPFFDNEYVIVWQNGVQLNMGAAPGQYGISGAGSPSGGLITLVTPAALNDIITIQGEMPIDRTSIYSATISNLTGSDLNGDFNREVVMMKQIQTTQALLQLQYAPWLQVSQDPDVTKDRYIPLLGAQQIWRMNEAGTEIEAFTIDNVPAPSNSPFVTYTEDPSLENPQNLGLLVSGLLKNIVTAGVADLQRAIPATDYWAPGNALTRTQPPTVDDDVVNKLYADSIASGFNFLKPVRTASTGNFSSTYNNGSSGVGATLTATVNGAATQDGVSLSLNDRALFKDQTNTFENGVYYVSQVGDGSTPAIYTRTTDFDLPSEIQPNTLISVSEGTANAETIWRETQTVSTIGTDPILFNQFGINPNDVVTISGAQTITGAKTFNANVALGNNAILTLNGTTSIDAILDEDDMVSNSPTAAATQQSIKAYIDTLIGDWVAYTPTISGFGTVSNVEIWSRRVGDILQIRGRFQSGTPTATEARITLGYNGTNANVSSSSTTITSIQLCGEVIFNQNSTGDMILLIESNTGYVTFGIQSGVSVGLTKINGNGVVVDNTWVVAFHADIPVDVWP